MIIAGAYIPADEPDAALGHLAITDVSAHVEIAPIKTST
jgi:hypothetical protein